MSMTNYTVQALLNSLFKKTSNFGALATAPTIYVGLSTTAPTEAGGNVTEPVGNNYARVATVAGDWNAATLADPSVVTNANAITFPTASGSWGSPGYWFLADAASAGNILLSAAITTPKAIGSGDTPRFAAGQISVSLD